jgi:predicted RNase H-like HicB family nuclease
MSPVTGKDLLKKVEELKGNPKKEIARALGYVTKTKTGQERVKLASFMNALLEAKGIGFAGSAEHEGRGGRSASYRIQVQQNGNLLVGAAYTREMGLEPGTEFEIQLGHDHIKLVKSETNSMKIIIHTAEEGGYWAEVPALPGCISEGDSMEEVRANIKDAIEGWLGVAHEKHLPVPASMDQIIEIAV